MLRGTFLSLARPFAFSYDIGSASGSERTSSVDAILPVTSSVFPLAIATADSPSCLPSAFTWSAGPYMMIPAVGELIAAARVGIQPDRAGKGRFDEFDRIAGVPRIDVRLGRLQRVSRMIEQHGQRFVTGSHFQQMNVVVSRRIADGADVEVVPLPQRDARGTLLVGDRSFDQIEDLVGQHAAIGEVFRANLNRGGMIVRRHQNQVRRRDLQLVAAPHPQNRRGDVETVEVIRDDGEPAGSVVEDQCAGINVVIDLRRLGSHHRGELFQARRGG